MIIYVMHAQTWKKKKKLIGKVEKRNLYLCLNPLNKKMDRGIVLFLGAEEKTVQALHGN